MVPKMAPPCEWQGDRRPRVLLVNPFDPLPYEPRREGRYGTLARLLAERGYRVTWVSSLWAHRAKSWRRHRRWEDGGVTVRAVRPVPYRRNVSAARIASHFHFGLLARRLVCRELAAPPGPPHVAIVSLPPLSPALLLVGLLERSGTRVIVDIQDLWPEALAGLAGPLGRALSLPLRLLRARALARASLVTAVSRDYLAALGHEPGGLVCRLGADLDDPPVREPAGSAARPASRAGGPHRGNRPREDGDSPLRVVFAGSLSRNYDLWTILEAAESTRGGPAAAHFTIAGDGPLLEPLRAAVRARRLDNVTLTGRLPHSEVCRLIAKSHVGLNAVLPASKCAFPNKVFDYLAHGGFVVNSIHGGELERLLEEKGVGTGYRAGDARSLLGALERARAAAAAPGARERIAAVGRGFSRLVEYEGLLDRVDELAGLAAAGRKGGGSL